MNMSIPFVMTKSGINLYLNGTMESISNDHPNYRMIADALLSNKVDVAEIESLICIPKAVAKFSNGRIIIDNDEFRYDGVPMHNALTVRIIDLLKKRKSVDSLIKFMENLMENPSHRAVNELYSFLEVCTLPITADGCFLAYKKVNNDYTSIHANPDGTHLDNSVGKTVKMPRNMVDDDPEQTCSNGLHVCSYDYLASFSGDRTVVCKVNPKNVVAVPVDYNNQKMRVCEYEVVSEIPNGEEIKDKYSTDEYSYTEISREPTAKTSATIGNWECRSAYDNVRQPRYYSNMTAGQAKAQYAKDVGIRFTSVRVRKA